MNAISSETTVLLLQPTQQWCKRDFLNFAQTKSSLKQQQSTVAFARQKGRWQQQACRVLRGSRKRTPFQTFVCLKT